MDKYNEHHSPYLTATGSANIPHVQISTLSLRGNHFSCCKPSDASYTY